VRATHTTLLIILVAQSCKELLVETIHREKIPFLLYYSNQYGFYAESVIDMYYSLDDKKWFMYYNRNGSIHNGWNLVTWFLEVAICDTAVTL
jgi:hypothetical protein